MKYCVFCAEELPDDANYCSRCGKPQNAAPPEKTPEPVKADMVNVLKAAAEQKAADMVNVLKAVAERKAAGQATVKPAEKEPPKPESKKFNKKCAIVYDYTARGFCEKRHCGFNSCFIFASKAASDPENYLTACMKIKKAMTAGIIEKLNSLDADD